jgi:hypothetical protein
MYIRVAAVLTLATLVAAASASVAESCGGGPSPENLAAPATLRTTLRSVFLKAHPSLRSEDVAGPLPGRTYYGTMGDFHAVATFEIKGRPAYPSTFWRNAGHPWRFSHDTHGGIRNTDISPAIMALWGFAQWRHSSFYVEPRARKA